ncbi:MAG: galactokinase [Cyanobacteria bacterium]|nr:galactokinase [Cyanobacteriota bacterium]
MANLGAFFHSHRAHEPAPEVMAAAHGRVNLIGEHTDYHQGFVLPMPIPQRTTVTVRRRSDYLVRASSTAMQPSMVEYEIGDEARGSGWLDYVQGVTYVLARTGRCALTGFDLTIDSSVPPGAGVSSSAALSVALLRALRIMCRFTIGDLEIAQLAQRVETEFIGAPIGIMDQMSCSLGHPDKALFIDTRSLHYERIKWPPHAGLIVINSGIVHAHAGGEYAVRRRESFSAAALLGVRYLRDATLDSLERVRLPSPLDRRARHVITENARVLEAVQALRDRDPDRLGELFNASHLSMKHDYETSTPEIDTLVEIAQADPGVYGARLTGGGFGGSVVMIAHAGRAAAAADRIATAYTKTAGIPGTVLVPDQSMPRFPRV